ncbi:MAG: redoxin family protein [Bdellovibrionia bacterium]
MSESRKQFSPPPVSFFPFQADIKQAGRVFFARAASFVPIHRLTRVSGCVFNLKNKDFFVLVLLFWTALVSQVSFALPERLVGFDLVQGQTLDLPWSSPHRATVLIFLSSKCPCSASHEPALEALYHEFSPQGVRFLGIHSNADEPSDVAHEHFKIAGLSFPVLQDSGAAIATELGAYKTPHVYLLNSKHEILFQGGVDNSHVAKAATRFYLKEALTAVISGKKPDPKEVRVLGCEIRR